MNCKRCDKSIDSTDMFCKHCGVAICSSVASTDTDIFTYKEYTSEITITGFRKKR